MYDFFLVLLLFNRWAWSSEVSWQDLLNKNLAEFKNEINTLSKIEHINLVRWYGYLEHGHEKIIVVEYISNGTLREHLDGKSRFIIELCLMVVAISHSLHVGL